MVNTSWLRAQGIDPKSIHDYVSRGWLERVIRGVYRRPLPEGVYGVSEDSWEIPLLSLQWIMKRDVHLGGESALNLAGYTHYLSLGGIPFIHLYGPVPSWVEAAADADEDCRPSAVRFSAMTRPALSTLVKTSGKPVVR